VLLEIEFYGEHELARADIVGLVCGIALGDINIYNLVDFSVADIQPFKLKINFFLNPGVLIRQIEERILVCIAFCGGHTIVPVESKCVIVRRIDVSSQIMRPSGVSL